MASPRDGLNRWMVGEEEGREGMDSRLLGNDGWGGRMEESDVDDLFRRFLDPS